MNLFYPLPSPIATKILKNFSHFPEKGDSLLFVFPHLMPDKK
jgi:hypothetical protein